MVVKCPDGTDSLKCGFPTPVTVTAGPSTLALTTVVGNSLTVDLECGIEGSTKASCTQVYTGPASLYTSTATGDDGSKTTTWIASQNLEGGKVSYLPVTITAGLSSTSASKAHAAAVPAPTGGVARIVIIGVVVKQLAAAIG